MAIKVSPLVGKKAKERTRPKKEQAPLFFRANTSIVCTVMAMAVSALAND